MFKYLHSKIIIYWNLKHENIMIDHLRYLKLTNFKFAKIVKSRAFMLCKTLKYLTPKMMLYKEYEKPVD